MQRRIIVDGKDAQHDEEKQNGDSG